MRGAALSAAPGTGPGAKDCLRSVIQVNGWMAPAGVMCSSRSWLVSSHPGAGLAGQFRRAVAGHGQARAVLRAVPGEAAEDGDGVRAGDRVQGVQVLLPVPIEGQEVEDRPVMPGPVMAPG